MTDVKRIYEKSNYFLQKFDLEHFPTSASANRMLSYVTEGFYENSYVGKWIFQEVTVDEVKTRKTK